MTDEALRDEPCTPVITDADLVFEGAVWDVRSERFRYGEGELVRQYVDHPGAVAIVAIDDADRMLVIQQYRHPIRMRDWELPAGLLDVDGEDPLAAAQRELAEEADLEASEWEHLASTYATPGGSNEVVHYYLARGLTATPDQHAREHEEADIRIEWRELSLILAAVDEGRMRNAILAYGVLAAQRRLQRG